MSCPALEHLFTRAAAACSESSTLRRRAKVLQHAVAATEPEPSAERPRAKTLAPPSVSHEAPGYKALFDNAPACIWTDARGVIRAANRAAALLVGLEAPRLTGKPLLHFVPRGGTRAFRALVQRLDEVAGGPSIQLVLRPRGGKPVAHEARVVRLAAGSFGWYLLPAAPAEASPAAAATL